MISDFFFFPFEISFYGNNLNLLVSPLAHPPESTAKKKKIQRSYLSASKHAVVLRVLKRYLELACNHVHCPQNVFETLISVGSSQNSRSSSSSRRVLLEAEKYYYKGRFILMSGNPISKTKQTVFVLLFLWPVLATEALCCLLVYFTHVWRTKVTIFPTLFGHH